MSNLQSAPTKSSRRRGAGLLVAGFLLLQLCVPLRYYLGADAADERFSWRMFSSYSRSVRRDLPNRQLIVFESVEKDGTVTENRVPLRSLLTKRWIKFAMRERAEVIRKLLIWRHSRPNVRSVRLDLTRFEEDGSRHLLVSYVLDENERLVRK